MLCPICSAEQLAGIRYCEDCGASLTESATGAATVVAPPAAAPSAQTCPECGAGAQEVDGDGFCQRCGHERVAPSRDHLEIVISPRFAGASDRGKRHHRNEDYLALTTAPAGDVLVVCDGVSSSQNPDAASQKAAETVCAVLTEQLGTGTTDLKTALQAAIGIAQAAVRKLPYSAAEKADPPETTLVAAVRRGRTVTLGWLGDSRAYYLGTAGVQLLTQDHSWLNEIVAAGKLTPAEARQSPKAHWITRSVGGPIGTDATGDEPSLATFIAPADAGYLLLCTDGLWNYAPEPERLAALVRQLGTCSDALTLARFLVAYALQQGGRDNITAVVLAL